ncbi:MAG: transposase [Emcibacter sp.]|nr:transposase [Emcibacter sp.]
MTHGFIYAGLDVSDKKTHICLIDGTGKLRWQGVCATDPVCRRLMTIPGVGPIVALTFKASIEDPARFKHSRDVGAYAGLTPRRFQSGDMAGQVISPNGEITC